MRKNTLKLATLAMFLLLSVDAFAFDLAGIQFSHIEEASQRYLNPIDSERLIETLQESYSQLPASVPQSELASLAERTNIRIATLELVLMKAKTLVGKQPVVDSESECELADSQNRGRYRRHSSTSRSENTGPSHNMCSLDGRITLCIGG